MRRAHPFRRLIAATAAAAVGVVVASAALTAGRPANDASADLSVSPAPVLDGEAWPVKVLVAGDSTGVALIERLERYAAAHPGLLEVVHSAFPGCGLTAGNDGRLHSWDNGNEWIDLEGCLLQWQSIPARVIDEQVDVVVISTGYFDGDDILLSDGTTVNVLDTVGHRMVEHAYGAFADAVNGTGAALMWVLPPDIDLGWDEFETLLDDPARWSALREVIGGLDVTPVDLPGWLAANGFEGPAGRPDGSHLGDEAGERFVDELLGPLLLAAGNPLLLAG